MNNSGKGKALPRKTVITSLKDSDSCENHEVVVAQDLNLCSHIILDDGLHISSLLPSYLHESRATLSSTYHTWLSQGGLK
jgi:hypothetical protein